MGKLKEQWTRLKTFFQEVWAELKRTTWPSQKEVRNTTVVVVAFVLVCAAYLYVVDVVLQAGMERLVRTFSQ